MGGERALRSGAFRVSGFSDGRRMGEACVPCCPVASCGAMTLLEIKRSVEGASGEDRLFLEAYLRHLNRADDPGNAADLDQRMREMDEGRKVSLSTALRLHESLKSEGL